MNEVLFQIPTPALYVAIFICLTGKASAPISRTAKPFISPEFKKPISDLNCSHCVVFVFSYALTQRGADSHSSLNTGFSFLKEQPPLWGRAEGHTMLMGRS